MNESAGMIIEAPDTGFMEGMALSLSRSAVKFVRVPSSPLKIAG